MVTVGDIELGANSRILPTLSSGSGMEFSAKVIMLTTTLSRSGIEVSANAIVLVNYVSQSGIELSAYSTTLQPFLSRPNQVYLNHFVTVEVRLECKFKHDSPSLLRSSRSQRELKHNSTILSRSALESALLGPQSVWGDKLL